MVVKVVVIMSLMTTLASQPVQAAAITLAAGQITLSWAVSAVWTGDQAGPRDANSRAWHDPAFDDSGWSSAALPAQALDTRANNRYYRARFTWDGNSEVSLSFVSDDGLTIYINGTSLGTWGNGWRQSGCINNPPSCFNSITVAPQVVPPALLRQGDNVIAVDVWNTAACCFHYFNLALVSPQPVGQWPIVLVHGYNGFDFQLGPCRKADPDSYFEQIDELLEQANLQVYTATLESSWCRTPPIRDNIVNLKNAINRVKSETQKSKVILVTHSMGGLVSRAYIEGEQYENDVAAVFTFGSPHLGIPIEVLIYQAVKHFGVKGGVAGTAILAAYCAVSQPALCDFTVTGMTLFNLQHHPRAGVPYFFVSGDAPLLSRNEIGWATGYLIPGPDDGIVPTDSGMGVLLPGITRRLSTQELHSKVFASRTHTYSTYFVSSTGATTESYDKCLARALINQQECGGVILTAHQAGGNVNVDMSEMTDRARQTQTTARTSVDYGTFTGTQPITRQITSEGGKTTFATMWQSGTVSVTLVSPTGQTIDPAYATANPGLVSHAASDDVATYAFTTTAPGAWQLVLQPDGLADGAAYATFAAFEGGASLAGQIDQLWYVAGETAYLTATLIGADDSTAIVQAHILRSDAANDSITLTQRAPGLYATTYVVPHAAGYAEIRFSASGNTPNGNAFTREANLAFQISPATANLTGRYAEATQPRVVGLPLYQALTITVGISATSVNSFTLSADLVDAAGNFVAHSLTTLSFGPGEVMLPLRFEGADIAASKRDGPYRLTNVLLTGQSGASGSLMALAQAQQAYETSTYRHNNFAEVYSLYLPLIQR
jgi:hypothetical protein